MKPKTCLPPCSRFATVICATGDRAATIAPVQNILTVLGDSVPNSGVPCFQCVTNGMGNTLGLVTPDASVHADGVTLYAFDNYLFDNSDTESCNYTFLVKDAAAKYILKLGPFALALTSSTAYITSISATLPKDPAAVGAGRRLLWCSVAVRRRRRRWPCSSTIREGAVCSLSAALRRPIA